MRNSFNILLVILAAYDTWYMFGAILETIRKFFMNLRTNLHLRMFPHFLYPLHQTSITGSIFMTVALAFERYSALNYPMEYNRVSTTTSRYIITPFKSGFFENCAREKNILENILLTNQVPINK